VFGLEIGVSCADLGEWVGRILVAVFKWGQSEFGFYNWVRSGLFI